MIKNWIEKIELLQTSTGIESNAETLSAHIGLMKTMKDYNLKKMISFHGRIEGAKSFVEEHSQVYEWVADNERPDGQMILDFVSGKMTTGERNQKLLRLKNSSNNERSLFNNG